MGIDEACVQTSPVYWGPPLPQKKSSLLPIFSEGVGTSVHRLVFMSLLKYRETLYDFNLGLPEYKGYTLCLLAGTDDRDRILARVKS